MGIIRVVDNRNVNANELSSAWNLYIYCYHRGALTFYSFVLTNAVV